MEDEQEASGFGLFCRHGATLSIKLLAIDVDGTLVGASGEVHPADREAIAALSQKGVATTIITGRLFSGTRSIAIDVGAVGAIGCVDGCHLVDVISAADLHHGGIAGEAAARLRDILVRFKAASFVFARNQILYDDRGTAHRSYMRTWSQEHIHTPLVTEHPQWDDPFGITALVSVGSQELIARLQAEIELCLMASACVAVFPIGRAETETTWGMVVRAAGYSKGTALAWLARHYGGSLEETVAVGDWYNDIPMFEAAGRSFVMAQAPEAVKRAATDRLTADIWSGGGIAEAARRAGLL